MLAKLRRPVIIAGVATLVLAAAVFTWRSHPLETATERAHRLCTQCGLDADEIDELIAIMRGPPDRETKLRLHREQFDDPTQAELCEPCAEAVLDAAEAAGLPGATDAGS